MMLVGIVWAVLAPALLLLPWLALRAFLRRSGVRKAGMLAAALVLGVVVAVHAADRLAFSTLCREIGRPVVMERADADGLYLNSGTANSFGTRYLHDEGFRWLERRDIYNRDGFVRVTRGENGQFEETKILGLTATYEVRERHEVRDLTASISWTEVVERATGRVLARAAHANFGGGRMRWVLGAYGSASCPSAFSDSAGFTGYYHLARDTLRPAAKQP